MSSIIVRPSGPKSRNGGQWTEARYNSFITSLLRGGTRRWGPKHEVKKAARVERGIYLCNSCQTEGPATVKIDGKRKDNAVVDHINPIVDPNVGFTSWDEYIKRMFCEADNLQVLCRECHETKSNAERQQAKERRANEK